MKQKRTLEDEAKKIDGIVSRLLVTVALLYVVCLLLAVKP